MVVSLLGSALLIKFSKDPHNQNGQKTQLRKDVGGVGSELVC
jgi:hypothetical protein